MGQANGTYALVSTSSLGISGGGGSGTVSSGTQGQFAFYNANGATVSGTSSIYLASNGNVGVGTTNPVYKLDLAGDINVDQYSGYRQNGVTILYATSSLSNVAVGQNALIGATGGANNTSYNVAIGYGALQIATSSTGRNVAIGAFALVGNTTGAYNVALGASALPANTTGIHNLGLGYRSLYTNTIGSDNVALGLQTFYSNIDGSGNIGLGNDAGHYLADGVTGATTSDNSLYLGGSTRSGASDAQNEVVIGNGAIGAGSNSVTLGNNSITSTLLKGNVGIATTTPWARLSIDTSNLPAGVPEFTIGSSTRQDFIVTQNGNVGIGTTSSGISAGC